jgi:hypothetical protein
MEWIAEIRMIERERERERERENIGRQIRAIRGRCRPKAIQKE